MSFPPIVPGPDMSCSVTSTLVGRIEEFSGAAITALDLAAASVQEGAITLPI